MKLPKIKISFRVLTYDVAAFPGVETSRRSWVSWKGNLHCTRSLTLGWIYSDLVITVGTVR